MKPRIALSFCLLLVWNAAGQESQNFSSASREFTSEQLIETWGWLLGQRFNLEALEFTESEVEIVARGMQSYIDGEDPPTALRESVNPMQNYFVVRENQIRERQMKEGKVAELAYFDSLFGRPGISALGSGLYFEILQEGSDEKPEEDDAVLCHYVGRFLDGEVFDSSYERGEPVEFLLDRVIPAWSQGVPLIGVGGKIRLHVPAQLGYGDAGTPGVPPASTLIFEVELLEILGEERRNAMKREAQIREAQAREAAQQTGEPVR